MTSESPPSEIPQKNANRLRLLLVTATLLFVAGLFLPMITLSRFILIKNSFSVFSGVVELLRNGQILLFLIVTGFSVVLPLMKIAVLYRLLSPQTMGRTQMHRYLHLMHEYGRWAMLDVLVVAVLIVTVKLGAIASIEVHPGLYVFGASVLLIMYITHRIMRLTFKQ